MNDDIDRRQPTELDRVCAIITGELGSINQRLSIMEKKQSATTCSEAECRTEVQGFILWASKLLQNHQKDIETHKTMLTSLNMKAQMIGWFVITVGAAIIGAAVKIGFFISGKYFDVKP